VRGTQNGIAQSKRLSPSTSLLVNADGKLADGHFRTGHRKRAVKPGAAAAVQKSLYGPPTFRNGTLDVSDVYNYYDDTPYGYGYHLRICLSRLRLGFTPIYSARFGLRLPRLGMATLRITASGNTHGGTY